MTPNPRSSPPHNSAADWFKASEALGDFMGIRYGRIPGGIGEVEWHFVSHCECDGIGGITRLLRDHGAVIDQTPTTRHPSRGTAGPLWRMWLDSLSTPACATRADWSVPSSPANPAITDVAWHLFSEQETDAIVDHARSHKVTVNSLLLQHLDTAVRPELGIPDAAIPWMVPVNLRGDVHFPDDTENHVSCITVIVAPNAPLVELHQQIRRRLERGEHRANFQLMQLGGILSHERKMQFLARDRRKPHGNLGVFSNLGSWDPDRRIETNDAWLFCPPITLGQRVAAGCLTFQRRLSLMLQTHRGAGTACCCMDRWVERINSIQTPAKP